MTTVTASTSLILVTTSNLVGSTIVTFPNISTTGRIITVRDNDGFANSSNYIILSATAGASFGGVSGSLIINQPFGFITLMSQTTGVYSVLNTFAFPTGSTAAFVSNITATNLATLSTMQFLDRATSNTATMYVSGGQIILNNNFIGQITSNQLQSTVTHLGSLGYLSTVPLFASTQIISSLQTNFLSAGTLTVGVFNPANITTTNLTATTINATTASATTGNFRTVSTGALILSSIQYRSQSLAIGSNAGVNQTLNAIAIGTQAASIGSAQGDAAIAIGQTAGYESQQTRATAIGQTAGFDNQAADAVAIGTTAGRSIQGISAVAIGNAAGYTSQTQYATAIGFQSGYQTQGESAIAIGSYAARTTQGSGAIAIGLIAGSNAQGASAVAIGNTAGATTQGASAVAIGNTAGSNAQGTSAVAIGNSAGYNSQTQYATAIGFQSGYQTQGEATVAIGAYAGQNTQGTYSVAVGLLAGQTNQGINAIALGYSAGQNTQGANAIAIGKNAGSNLQSTNTIVLNATGDPLNTPLSNASFIKPIRQDLALNTTKGQLYYTSTTGELTYGPILVSTFSTLNTTHLSVLSNTTLGTSLTQISYDSAGYANIEHKGPFGSYMDFAASSNRDYDLRIGYFPSTVGYAQIQTKSDSSASTIAIMPKEGTGRVGINTTTPDFNLDVYSTVQIRYNDGISEGLFRFLPNGINGNVIRYGGTGSGANTLRFLGTGNTEAMRISSGNIGIGTSTPSYKLDVVGNANINQFTTATVTSGDALRVGNVSGGRNIRFFTNLSAGNYGNMTSNGDMAIVFSEGSIDTGNMWIGPHSASTKGIKILANGNVGIGTAGPSYTLDITGTFRVASNANNFTTLSYAGGLCAMELKGDSGAYIDIGRSNVDYDARIIYQAPNGHAEFTTNAVASNIAITPNGGTGRVGINTISPQYTLDVNGTIKQQGITTAVGVTSLANGTSSSVVYTAAKRGVLMLSVQSENGGWKYDMAGISYNSGSSTWSVNYPTSLGTTPTWIINTTASGVTFAAYNNTGITQNIYYALSWIVSHT